MGGCTSPWFADLALELLEVNLKKNLHPHIPYYRRYVDDCFLIVKWDKVQTCLDELNNFNQHLQFDHELKEIIRNLS